MCGITGIWEYAANDGRVQLPLIERMRDSMTHRGPDDAGSYLFDNGRGGFGFRRLSIVDLSAAGHQPMTGCASRGVWLAFNGEIYNHAEIRAGLMQRGHEYHSQTDSETIVHLYEERGADFVDEIDGDFAIAIWDADRAALSLYRDRLGVKPLYYYSTGGRFIFGSEIKAILGHPSVERDIDQAALDRYLTFVTTPVPQTLFKGIRKLGPGERLIINRKGEVRIDQYWDALPLPRTERSESEHIDEILRLLRESIKKRMMSDVPFGVFLSGGVDSSANVALMSELSDQAVSTFTVGYEGHDYLNELEQARRIATRYNTDHHEIIIGDKEFEDFLPDLIFHQDEPLADPVSVPLYYVSKLARESGTIVVQVGEGADEVFGGYDKYVANLRLYEGLWKHAANAPASLKKLAARFAAATLMATGMKPSYVELARRFERDEPMFWGAAVIFDEALKSRLLSNSFRWSLNGNASLDIVENYLSRITQLSPNADFLSKMTYLELKIRLAELLLMRVDKITMAASVEARVPFLDHHLVEYAMALPQNLKINGRTGKYILKRALESVLPHDLLYARKRGFGAPIREIFKTSLGAEFRERLLRGRIRQRGYFDYQFIAKMADEHASGKHDWSFHLWALLNLTLWYERWIDREK